MYPLYEYKNEMINEHMTSYTPISIENLLFGSDNLTDGNNLIVFRNEQKYIPIYLDDIKLYSVPRMLSYICTQSPYPLFPTTSVYYIYLCIHLIYM